MSSQDQDQLRVLIVGNGGREHALAWKLSQSPRVDAVYVAPGNGGTGLGVDGKIASADVKGNDYPGLVKFAQQNGVNMVVPGPEAPLVEGIQGYFQAGILLPDSDYHYDCKDMLMGKSQSASVASVPPRPPPAWKAPRLSPRTS